MTATNLNRKKGENATAKEKRNGKGTNSFFIVTGTRKRNGNQHQAKSDQTTGPKWKPLEATPHGWPNGGHDE